MNRRNPAPQRWAWALACVAVAGMAAVAATRSKVPQAGRPAAGAITASAPLAPLVTAPEPAASSVLVPAPRGTWLPWALARQEPRPLPSDGQHALAVRTSADRPPVAGATPALPSAIVLPAGPPAYAAGPLVGDLSGLPSAALPGPDGIDLTCDPTLGEAREAVLVTTPQPRRTPAAMLRLVLPDPFELITAVQLRQAPADDDPPAPKVDPPLPRPVLTPLPVPPPAAPPPAPAAPAPAPQPPAPPPPAPAAPAPAPKA